jgi:cytochrome c peroxidase
LLFFDKITGLHSDNTYAGCHSPTNGFGDTQSIAIGVQNNNLVGPDRAGPRNQRRSPMVINNAFYRLVWTAASAARRPFVNAGHKFPPGRHEVPRRPVPPLLILGHIPPLSSEVAGFTGLAHLRWPGSRCGRNPVTGSAGVRQAVLAR